MTVRSGRIRTSRRWPAAWTPRPCTAEVQPPREAPSRPATAGRGPILTTDADALFAPGVAVVVDPDRAEQLGAFVEDALSFEDVLAAQDQE
jgi:hypothetical protein